MLNKKGFTLIELLIVIVVIGILSVAVVPRVMEYPKKARDAARKGAITALDVAMMAVISDKNPDGPVDAKLCITDALPNSDLKSYMSTAQLPVDPGAAAQKFGATICAEKKYYYIMFRDAVTLKITGYAFVAPMEAGIGNSDTDPTGIADLAALKAIILGTSGKYFYTKQIVQ